MSGVFRGLRWFRRWMAGSWRGMPGHPMRGLEVVFQRATVLVPAVYGVMFFSALNVLPHWEGVMARTQLQLLWPVGWLDWVPLREGILGILVVFTAGTGLAMLFPGQRWVRVLAMLGMVMFWALNNSTGKIGHSLHLSVWLSIWLVGLPSGWNAVGAARAMRLAVAHAVVGMQVVVLLSYSMAGLVKVGAGVMQLLAGEPNLFSPDSLGRHIADRLLQTGSSSLVGEALIGQPWLGGPLMWATVYLELFALWAVFRPRLQAAFALGLILFHVGSFFTMTIIFPQNCILLGLLVGAGTGWRPGWSWRGFIGDLPLVGWVFRWMGGRGKASQACPG